jgi:hypothetical protein
VRRLACIRRSGRPTVARSLAGPRRRDVGRAGRRLERDYRVIDGYAGTATRTDGRYSLEDGRRRLSVTVAAGASATSWAFRSGGLMALWLAAREGYGWVGRPRRYGRPPRPARGGERRPGTTGGMASIRDAVLGIWFTPVHGDDPSAPRLGERAAADHARRRLRRAAACLAASDLPEVTASVAVLRSSGRRGGCGHPSGGRGLAAGNVAGRARLLGCPLANGGGGCLHGSGQEVPGPAGGLTVLALGRVVKAEDGLTAGGLLDPSHSMVRSATTRPHPRSPHLDQPSGRGCVSPRAPGRKTRLSP